MTRLIRGELLKIRTTNTWWLFGLGALVMTGVALTINSIQAHFFLKPFDDYLSSTRRRGPGDLPRGRLTALQQEWAANHDVIGQAAKIFTSGQFIGVLIVMLLGILLITNEYHHQTVTTTFLNTPHRTTVVLGKLVTGVLLGAFFWLATTAVNLVVGSIFLHSQGCDSQLAPSQVCGSQLGHWEVIRAILLNLAAYAIWAVFGIGFGALVRSQLGATVTATVLYLAGTAAGRLIFELIHTFWIDKDWVLTAQVVIPSVASQVMISPVKTFEQSPQQWVGAVVLIGYGLVAGVIGTWILRRRDVS